MHNRVDEACLWRETVTGKKNSIQRQLIFLKERRLMDNYDKEICMRRIFHTCLSTDCGGHKEAKKVHTPTYMYSIHAQNHDEERRCVVENVR